MHDGTVGTGARNRRKAEIAEIFALAAQRLEPVAGGDLGEPARWRFAREPGEKPGQCRAVAAMRRPRPDDLDRVLAGLRQEARVGGAMDPGSGRGEPIKDP